MAYSLLIAQNINVKDLTINQVSESAKGAPTKSLKVGVIGLVHTHVHWILGREKRGDIEIVGIVEPNKDLASQYARQHGYSMDIVYDTMPDRRL
jgi:hypothetical protein